jgi:hypothetical protein
MNSWCSLLLMGLLILRVIAHFYLFLHRSFYGHQETVMIDTSQFFIYYTSAV